MSNDKTKKRKAYKPSKKVLEKRQKLIELSEVVEQMILVGDRRLEGIDTSTKNNVIMKLFYPAGEYHLYDGWKEKGFQVQRDQKSFAIWGKPREFKRKIEDDNSGNELERKYKAFPIANIYHESQVQPIESKKEA